MLATCLSREDLVRLLQTPELRDRYAFVDRLSADARSERSLRYRGFCTACRQPTEFRIDADTLAGAGVPEYRERLKCAACGLNSRQRMAMHFLDRLLRDDASPKDRVLFLMEQVTPIYRCCRTTHPLVTVIGAEYLGPEVARGAVVDGIRHEDVEDLTLADESIDVVMSNDVMEHVPNPWAGFREIHRVLRPGGHLFLTVPFDLAAAASTVSRAALEDGEVRHLLPAVFHGNPVSREGSLVYSDFGWDLLPRLREIGFLRVSLEVAWSYLHGFLEIPGLFFHAVK